MVLSNRKEYKKPIDIEWAKDGIIDSLVGTCADATNMTRMGESDEIAQTALFLALNDSSFENGTVVTAVGGWTD